MDRAGHVFSCFRGSWVEKEPIYELSKRKDTL